MSVDRQEQVAHWTNWNSRHGSWSVQPSHYYLNYLYTVRIHLDYCDEKNGALKVIPGSHRLGILPDADLQTLNKSQATICAVLKGGLLIMRPLLVHASGKSTSNTNRRVIHLELTDRQLPKGLQWREFSRRWTKIGYTRKMLTLNSLP
ncbi:phytanoyl-CoA dioxygenase family protein [Spirosoma sp. BT702]|uniref:Phytanoyl-CoA dioxygenase family protein n=1 Tax=Spirosoma profusum TaxID=2771354 RepID=A0A927ARB2_9BACT|nr:phytanoyl-CoA dioxygenase family protein [Spirosoma profusum]